MVARASNATRWSLASAARVAQGEALLQGPDVVAVGTGLREVGGTMTDQPCVTVFVARKLPRKQLTADRVLPRVVSVERAAVAIDVVEMGVPSAPPLHAASRARLVPAVAGIGPGVSWRRFRPVLGGTSAAHHRFPTGTVAIGVSDRWFPWVRYVLSCNHVLALINGARVGDPVVQPAPGDGGVVWRDVVASVVRFVPLRFGSRADNLVDAAVAVTPAGEVLDAVAWLGTPRRVRPALSVRPGERVVKVGRSSGLTTGRVTAVDVSVVIAYPWVGQVARFSRQIVTTGMCAYGDSGSLLFDGRGDALGMLFAGTPTHTMYNALEYVENELGVAVAARRFRM